MKSKAGDAKVCAIVEFVERTQFGDERGVEVLVAKSPEGKRFVVVVQPAGSVGAVTVSKRSA